MGSQQSETGRYHRLVLVFPHLSMIRKGLDPSVFVSESKPNSRCFGVSLLSKERLRLFAATCRRVNIQFCAGRDQTILFRREVSPESGHSETVRPLDSQSILEADHIIGTKPVVTVGITTLNAAAQIESCLTAIFRQEYPKELLEVVVVDAGSTDATVEIAQRFETRVFVAPGCTRGRGRNICLEHANGEIFAMVDADNVIPPDWLEKLILCFSDDRIAHASMPHNTLPPGSGLISSVVYHLAWL